MVSASALGMVLFGTPIADRATAARERVAPILQKLVGAAKLDFPPKQIFFRAFKDEKTIEVWGAASPTSKHSLIKKYLVLAASGRLGPKRMSGDMQVPEGWYYVNRFNPLSAFHLSLGLNYPNRVDLVRSANVNPGGDIFIHGNQVSAGCLAMGDSHIDEIYTLARMAKGKVFVLILPSRSNPAKSTDAPHKELYSQIYSINRAFERNYMMPKVDVNARGFYRVL